MSGNLQHINLSRTEQAISECHQLELKLVLNEKMIVCLGVEQMSRSFFASHSEKRGNGKHWKHQHKESNQKISNLRIVFHQHKQS